MLLKQIAICQEVSKVRTNEYHPKSLSTQLRPANALWTTLASSSFKVVNNEYVVQLVRHNIKNGKHYFQLRCFVNGEIIVGHNLLTYPVSCYTAIKDVFFEIVQHMIEDLDFTECNSSTGETKFKRNLTSAIFEFDFEICFVMINNPLKLM